MDVSNLTRRILLSVRHPSKIVDYITRKRCEAYLSPHLKSLEEIVSTLFPDKRNEILEDVEEGIRAFAEKRKPAYKGR